MAKFNVLERNQAFMARLGIYSYRLTEPTIEFFNSIGTYYIFISLSVPILLFMLVLYHTEYTELDIILDAVFVIIALSQCLGAFISIGVNMKKVKVLHLKLQSIVDGSRFFF